MGCERVFVILADRSPLQTMFVEDKEVPETPKLKEAIPVPRFKMHQQ